MDYSAFVSTYYKHAIEHLHREDKIGVLKKLINSEDTVMMKSEPDSGASDLLQSALTPTTIAILKEVFKRVTPSNAHNYLQAIKSVPSTEAPTESNSLDFNSLITDDVIVEWGKALAYLQKNDLDLFLQSVESIRQEMDDALFLDKSDRRQGYTFFVERYFKALHERVGFNLDNILTKISADDYQQFLSLAYYLIDIALGENGITNINNEKNNPAEKKQVIQRYHYSVAAFNFLPLPVHAHDNTNSNHAALKLSRKAGKNKPSFIRRRACTQFIQKESIPSSQTPISGRKIRQILSAISGVEQRLQVKSNAYSHRFLGFLKRPIQEKIEALNTLSNELSSLTNNGNQKISSLSVNKRLRETESHPSISEHRNLLFKAFNFTKTETQKQLTRIRMEEIEEPANTRTNSFYYSGV